jgi:agmatinase
MRPAIEITAHHAGNIDRQEMNREENGFSRLAAEAKPNTVAVIGVPLDENSSFMRGPAKAPPVIREVLHSKSGNMYAENGLDLGTSPGWKDLGDLQLSQGKEAFAQIEKSVFALLSRDVRVVALGGDHSITYPIVRGHARKYQDLSLLLLDAHTDLYDELDGNRISHASPFARIMEENLASRLVQLGIRTLTAHQRDQVERFGVEVVEMRDWRVDTPVDLKGPVYLSIDMDCLDPAFAPGVSHHEPGGFSTRDVLGIIQRLTGPVVGADIVEFNPDRDPVGITAATAAKLLKEVLACMID